jgi:hypothetical protein
VGVRRKRRKVNAPRQTFPTMLDKETGLFTERYRKYMAEMSICYDLVDIAKEALDRPDLRLIAGGEGDGITKAATDGTSIYLPKMHPRRLIAIKHELAHIYFESDLSLRWTFVQTVIRGLADRSPEPLNSLTRDRLSEDLSFLVNILDDIRVNSLWGLLYPGDGIKMDEWYFQTVAPAMFKRAMEEYEGGDVDHLFTYAILLCLNQEPTSTRWGRFREDIEEARDNAYFKDFEALLIVVRSLVEKIADELARDQDTPPVAERVAGGARPGGSFNYDNAGFNHTESGPQPSGAEELERQIEALRRIKEAGKGDTEQAIAAGESRQLAKVEGLQRRMAEIQARMMFDESEETETRRVKATVRTDRVKRGDVVPFDLSPKDRDTAVEWRRYFQKVLGATRRRVAPEGYELIPSLYISQRLNKQPLVCYRRPMTGRGFRLRLLVDLSGSMQGYKFDQAQRLYAVLQEALAFPFVDVDVLGFYSATKGVVNIVRYDRGVSGLLSARSRPGGITPLPHAIQVAGADLMAVKHESFLFVLSDGMPLYRLANSGTNGRRAYVDKKTLMNWTSDAVRELLERQVKTFCFMVGRGHGIDVPQPEAMDKMFGVRQWELLTEDEMFRKAFLFIRDRFLRFLRTR